MSHCKILWRVFNTMTSIYNLKQKCVTTLKDHSYYNKFCAQKWAVIIRVITHFPLFIFTLSKQQQTSCRCTHRPSFYISIYFFYILNNWHRTFESSNILANISNLSFSILRSADMDSASSEVARSPSASIIHSKSWIR